MSVRFDVNDVVVVYVHDYGGKQGIGLIKYIGSIRDSSESYVGIELIEPISEGHDGIIDGHRYFDCKPLHGIHVSMPNVIKKLESPEVMLKLQEVIAMFKRKLNEYMHAVHERDVFIKDLQSTTASSAATTSQQQQQRQFHDVSTPFTNSNTMDTGSPSSGTPAPQSIRTKQAEQPPVYNHNPNIVIHHQQQQQHLHTLRSDERTDTAPMVERRLQLHSPSHPPLHLQPQTSHMSTLSPHSPNTPYGAIYLCPEYPDLDNDDATSSYLSPHSSAYTTPQSAQATNKLGSNARNLMAKYYADRQRSSRSTTATNHNHSNKHSSRRSGSHHTQHTHSKRKSDSVQSKRRSASSAHAQQHKKELKRRKSSLQHKPHITGSETPAFHADNDAVLSFPAFDQSGGGGGGSCGGENKRRKSKELLRTADNDDDDDDQYQQQQQQQQQHNVNRIRISTANSTRQNRSVSAEFTPSQMQRRYTFQTIEEEPEDVTPRFKTFHSTPIFTAQSLSNPSPYQHAYHNAAPVSVADTMETMEDEPATPDLPPQQTMAMSTSPYNVMYQPYPFSANDLHGSAAANMPPLDALQLQASQSQTQHRMSLPLQPTKKVLKTRQNARGMLHRSSLPVPAVAAAYAPVQDIGHGDATVADAYGGGGGRHMSRSSEMDIQLPHFSSQSNTMPTHNPSIPQFNSLRDIHEQQKAAAQMHHVPQAPQLDHWIAPHQPQLQQHSQPPPTPESVQPLPPLKSKSMPSPGHFPSQHSLDMNPYIDVQYIFQPQYAQTPNPPPVAAMDHAQLQYGMHSLPPPISMQQQQHHHHHQVNMQHTPSYSPLQYPQSSSRTPSNNNSPHVVAVPVPVPVPMVMQSSRSAALATEAFEYNEDEITKMINAQIPQSKIGRVEYAPRRRSASNQAHTQLQPRRKSSALVSKPPYPEPRSASQTRNSKGSSSHLHHPQQQQQRVLSAHHRQPQPQPQQQNAPRQHRKRSKTQNSSSASEMAGFEITDEAMYD